MADFSVFFILPGASSLFAIQRHFLERTLDMRSMEDALMGVGCTAAALALIMAVLHFRKPKPRADKDWIVDPGEIKKTIDVAVTQRSKFEIQVSTEGEARRPALRCSAVSIGGTRLVLEASGLTAFSSEWAGKPVTCFFTTRSREMYLFYAFITSIVSINVDKDTCRIHIELPEKLESRQKRAYLRITPPEEYMLGAAIWRDQDIPGEEKRGNLALWPKPSRIWLPGTREDFTVHDISSGGMRLHLSRHALLEEMDVIHDTTHFITMLDLWDPDKAKRLRFWLLCRKQTPVLDFETKGMDIGVQFLAWAKPAEPGASTLLWLKLASSGEVEPLGNWIMRRHLEIFREAEQMAGFYDEETA